jgi:hypothetical protein
VKRIVDKVIFDELRDQEKKGFITFGERLKLQAEVLGNKVNQKRKDEAEAEADKGQKTLV